MKALCYVGKNKLDVQSVNDPEILLPQDIILKVKLSSVCGSDLHYLHGYIPAMKEGDILGHEYTGEVIEVGSGVKRLKKGDRVVVAPNIGCGHCYHCEHDEWSLCDNSNPNGIVTEKLVGYPTGAFVGCSAMFGGYSGSHAEYIRVPYADHGCFKIPETLSYEQGLFASDAFSTGYMAADIAVRPGDIVAIWGAGAVGQMAAASAWLKGASRVFIIDRYDFRLQLAIIHAKAEPLNYERIDILEKLKEETGGRGPDVCIDCVGMEANTTGFEEIFDKVKQNLFLESDRASALRQAIMACRKGGVLSVIGVYSGFADKFPIGPLVVKGITVKSGMVHAQKYIPTLLKHIENGDVDPTYLQTHSWSLEQGNAGYKFFGENRNECLRGVFKI
jgi:threonine dehydrogenase-like Zn-dependent dehydrogenase